MHSQKPISRKPEIDVQIYSTVPVQIIYDDYMDFTEIWDKRKQTACEEEWLLVSGKVGSIQLYNMLHGDLRLRAHSSEGQEGEVTMAVP